MPRLSELLSAEDQEKVRKWKEDRFNPKHETDIPPELYTMAELGYYYGWGAIETVFRGYIEARDDAGRPVKLPFNLETAVALCKAAQKVNYRKMFEAANLNLTANVAAKCKNPGKVFEDNTKEIRKVIQ